MADLRILIPSARLGISDLEPFRKNPFDTMIKFVVDLDMNRIALGGEMHSDAEEQLLKSGSQQEDLWGGNLWPWEEKPRVEYVSLINIRPSVDNNSMDILSPDVRHSVDNVVHSWIELP